MFLVWVCECGLAYVALYAFCDYVFFFFFKQKTAYEMRISDWSSDVCSSDLLGVALLEAAVLQCIARGFLHGQNLGPSRPGSSERARLLQGRFRGRSRALRARRLRLPPRFEFFPACVDRRPQIGRAKV